MSADERHLNLIFVLLNTKRLLTREELRTKVGGYDPAASEDAFQRMFERDKKDIKKRGIEIETAHVDPGFNDEWGYRIDPDKFFLPDLELDGPDRVILSEAAKVWNDQQLAKLAEDAAGKIVDGDEDKFDDGDADEVRPMGLSLGLSLSQEEAVTLFNAIDQGMIVQFDYLTKGESAPKLRTVDPWQIVLSGGHWYLVGFDHTREEQRTFKLARFKSEVVITNKAITHFKPDDFNILSVVSFWRQTHDGDGLAKINVRQRCAGTLRLQADSIESVNEQDVLTIRYTNEEILARDIVTVLPDVYSIEPESLRDAVFRIVRETKNRHEL